MSEGNEVVNADADAGPAPVVGAEGTSGAGAGGSNGDGAPGETIIRVSNLHRYYGDFHAVKGVSFEIEKGHVVGFIGANGAGKTTTMRMMVTLDVPSRGRIEIAGYDVLSFPHRVRERVGWMPDEFGTYNNVNVFEYLDFYARAYGLKGDDRVRRVNDVMEFTDLDELAERPMNGLSKGMGQRLCLGRTLLHDPEVLILDEPAAGLDPKARIELKNLIRLLSEQGKTIFISSHILSELGEMCHSLLFINDGKIVHQGSAESLKYDDSAEMNVEVSVAGDPERFYQWVDLNPGVALKQRHVGGGLITVEGSEPTALSAVLRRMVADGVEVVEFHRVQQKLEDAFVNLLRTIENDGGDD